MPTYKAPLADMQFILHEVINPHSDFSNMPYFSEATPELMDAVLDEAAKFCENVLFPINQSGDEEGCQFKDGKVITPSGFKEAYQQFVEAGWLSLNCSPEYGGQGLPQCLNVMVEEMLCAANTSFSLYPSLTHGVYHALSTHGTDELKQKFLPSLTNGKWAGVMCLTEAHAGTDLGMIRTKAEPTNDGLYKISGTKIFITGGEQDLTENIIHLVLAKLPNAPAGPKGISLFLVPKIWVNQDGSLGEANHVSCGSIEHKMGIKASSTCVMNYDGAKGYLIGEENKGLSALFTMMNLERLAIGLEGIGIADVAYQNASLYAKDRIQGRSPISPTQPDKAADPIIVHPDIRRMLLTVKSCVESGRAFAAWLAYLHDVSQHHADDKTRMQAHQTVDLLTPVMKAFITDYGFENCNLCLQTLGGHGYIKEWGIEQFVRDIRIAQIYEGANGIQALDLMRRKIVGDKGEMLGHYFETITTFLQSHHHQALKHLQQPLILAIEKLKTITTHIIQKSATDSALIGACSYDYLHCLGLISLAFMWNKMAAVAATKAKQNEFYQWKLDTADFFMARIFPRIETLFITLQNNSDHLMKLPEQAF